MRKNVLAALFIIVSLVSLTLAQDKVVRRPMYPPPAASPFLNDTFTESSDISIFSHTADVGGGYTRHFAGSYASGDITVDSTLDRIYASGTGAIFVLSNATPPSADYLVQADFRILTNLGNASIYARARTSTSEDGIQLRCNPSNGNWELRIIVGGTQQSIDFSSTNFPTVGGAAVTVQLIVSGNSITVKANGSTIITKTDSTISAAGAVGIRFSAPMSSTTGIHIDNLLAQ